MNTVVILTILFGGILFFLLNTLFFDMNRSNIKHIIMTVVAFIPVLGLVWYGMLFFYCIAYYEKDAKIIQIKDYSESEIYIKDTKLNRWLFNDVEWSLIDSMKNELEKNNRELNRQLEESNRELNRQIEKNNAEAENCRIVTRFDGVYEGTFQLNNASIHVNADYNDAKRKYTDMEVVLDFAKTVVVMNRGQILEQGETRKILADTELLGKARLLQPQIAQVSTMLGNDFTGIFTIDEMISKLKSLKLKKGENA